MQFGLSIFHANSISIPEKASKPAWCLCINQVIHMQKSDDWRKGKCYALQMRMSNYDTLAHTTDIFYQVTPLQCFWSYTAWGLMRQTLHGEKKDGYVYCAKVKNKVSVILCLYCGTWEYSPSYWLQGPLLDKTVKSFWMSLKYAEYVEEAASPASASGYKDKRLQSNPLKGQPQHSLLPGVPTSPPHTTPLPFLFHATQSDICKCLFNINAGIREANN